MRAQLCRHGDASWNQGSREQSTSHWSMMVWSKYNQLLWNQVRQRRFVFAREPGRLWTVSVSSTDFASFQAISHELNRNRAPPGVWVGFGVVTDRIEMRQVVADGSKGSIFIAPILGEVCLASRRCGHPLKHRSGHRFQASIAGTDHVDGDTRRLGEFRDILRGDDAGVVGTIRKDHHNFSSTSLSGIFEGQQKSIVKSGLV